MKLKCESSDSSIQWWESQNMCARLLVLFERISEQFCGSFVETVLLFLLEWVLNQLEFIHWIGNFFTL